MRLFLLLMLVPLVEIVLFIKVGGLIGVWPTIGIVLLTAIIGSSLLRRQGLAALRSVQGRLAAGENPGRLLADGAMILIAGVLLLTPGFLTDAIGFAMLVPAVRRWLYDWLAPRMAVTRVDVRRTRTWGDSARGGRPDGAAGGETVEGEYEVVEPGAGRPEGVHPPADRDRR